MAGNKCPCGIKAKENRKVSKETKAGSSTKPSSGSGGKDSKPKKVWKNGIIFATQHNIPASSVDTICVTRWVISMA